MSGKETSLRRLYVAKEKKVKLLADGSRHLTCFHELSIHLSATLIQHQQFNTLLI